MPTMEIYFLYLLLIRFVKLNKILDVIPSMSFPWDPMGCRHQVAVAPYLDLGRLARF